MGLAPGESKRGERVLNKNKGMKEIPKLRIEFDLFTGGRIGTIQVFSDVALSHPSVLEDLVKQELRRSAWAMMDRLMIEGAKAIAEKYKVEKESL